MSTFNRTLFQTVNQSHWSVLQILLPIITALVAVFLTVVIMHLIRSQRPFWQTRMLRHLRPIPRVKNVEKYDSWEIEANDGGQYELVAPQSGTSDMYAFGPKSAQQMQAQHQPLHRGGHSRTDSEAFEGDDASGWGSLKNMRMPWKKGSNKVQEVLATTEFDIDDYNASSTTVGLTSDGDSQQRSAGNDLVPSASKVDAHSFPATVTDISATHVQAVNVGQDYSDPFAEQRSNR